MRVLASLLLASGLVLASPSAHADANAEARFYFERGNAELARGMRAQGPARRQEIERAVADYLQSLRIVRSKNTVYNLAVCSEELGQLGDAYDYFAEYLRSDINDAERAEASRRLELVRPRVALVEVATTPPGATVFVDRRDLAPRGVTPITFAVSAGQHHAFVELGGHAPEERDLTATVGQTVRVEVALRALLASITVEVPGGPAELTVDGRPVGQTPSTLRLSPGSHELRVQRVGAEELRERISVAAGEERLVRLSLSSVPLPGAIAVRANVVAAQVTVDGVSWGAASTRPRGVAPGRHTVEVSAPGYQPAVVTLDVRQEQAVEVRARLAMLHPPRRGGALPVATGIGAGVSLLVGAITGLTALKSQDDLEDIERDLGSATEGELQQARHDAGEIANRIDTLNHVADGCFIGAAVLGALTVTVLATSGGEGPTESSATLAGVGAAAGRSVAVVVEGR